MSPRRVMLVIGQLHLGGAERQLFELAVRLDRSRYLPEVVCLSQVSEPFGALLRQGGVPVETLGRSGHRDLGRALRLAGLIEKRAAHLVHSYLLAANAYTYVATRLSGRRRPYIASSRTCIPPAGWWSMRVHARAFRSAKAVIANSRRVMEFTRGLYGVDERRLHIIPNGVDLTDPRAGREGARAAARAALRLPDDAVVVGTIGRLSPEKNPRLFLEMAARVAAVTRGSLFIMVGDGKEMGELRGRAERLGLSDRLMLLGARQDVGSLLSGFDLFVSPSDTEGMPNAVMEAMAAGLPVVATRVGGTDEVVEEGSTGYLVERGDLAALTERTAQLVADPEARRLMGRRGRERVEREFSIQRMVTSTMALYDEVLA